MSKELEDIAWFWYMMGGGLILAGIGASITNYLEERKFKKEVEKKRQGILYEREHSPINTHFEGRSRSFEEGWISEEDFKQEMVFCLKYYFNFLNSENQRKIRDYTIKLGNFT